MARSLPVNAASLAGLAALLVGASYVLLGDVSLNLTDEGFLWYGVVRVLHGEVPMRDFQSYDPGRYLWCAGWSQLFGDGILGVRAGAAIFQAIGLFFALLVCRRVTRNLAALAFAAVLLWAWMFPRHKLFEPALAMMAVYFALRWIENPAPRNQFSAGVFTGLAGWFGCNHGLYLTLIFLLVAAFLAWKDERGRDWRGPLRFGLGGVLGSAPLWGMLLFVPGFARGFLDSLGVIAEHGVNRPEPFPWPWHTELAGLGGFELCAALAIAGSFLLPLLLYPAGLLVAATSSRANLERRAVASAASLVGSVYFHHVLVRSDIGHLGQCVPPLLLLTLALPTCLAAAPLVRALVWGTLGTLTFFVALDSNPSLAHLAPGKPQLVEQRVAGETLRLFPALASSLAGIEGAVRAHVDQEEALFIAPTRPTLYPLLGRKSPLWWIYFILMSTTEEQRETIERLDATPVNWALIVDAPGNGREDLRFRRTNPEVWEHLVTCFDRVEDARLPEGHFLFHRRGDARR